MKTLILTTIAFFIGISSSLYVGYQYGKEDMRADLKAAHQEIEVLRTYKTSQEYYIIDAKRKEAAFEEIVRIEMDESN